MQLQSNVKHLCSHQAEQTIHILIPNLKRHMNILAGSTLILQFRGWLLPGWMVGAEDAQSWSSLGRWSLFLRWIWKFRGLLASPHPPGSCRSSLARSRGAPMRPRFWLCGGFSPTGGAGLDAGCCHLPGGIEIRFQEWNHPPILPVPGQSGGLQ